MEDPQMAHSNVNKSDGVYHLYGCECERCVIILPASYWETVRNFCEHGIEGEECSQCFHTVKREELMIEWGRLAIEMQPTGVPKPLHFGVLVGDKLVALIEYEKVKEQLEKFEQMKAAYEAR